MNGHRHRRNWNKAEIPPLCSEPTITTKDTGSNVVTQAEKNAILKARAKEEGVIP